MIIIMKKKKKMMMIIKILIIIINIQKEIKVITKEKIKKILKKEMGIKDIKGVIHMMF